MRRKSGAFGKRFEEQRGRGGDWIINKSFVCCANDSDVSEEGLGLPFWQRRRAEQLDWWAEMEVDRVKSSDRFRVRGSVQW